MDNNAEYFGSLLSGIFSLRGFWGTLRHTDLALFPPAPSQKHLFESAFESLKLPGLLLAGSTLSSYYGAATDHSCLITLPLQHG